MAAVLFPSADALSALRHIDADAGGRRLVLCINPQWRPDGQVISDFGCVFGRREISAGCVAQLLVLPSIPVEQVI